ncbi:MAG: hypothetical protein IPH31_27010 [Lewinellaceae bacterium]|nr:hypothetical protein [Lewinellaceae bacterium]
MYSLRGMMPITFVWSNGISAQQVNQLLAGTYTVTMTDSKGTKANSVAMTLQTKGISSVTARRLFCNRRWRSLFSWSGIALPGINGEWTRSCLKIWHGRTVTVIDANGCSPGRYGFEFLARWWII